MELELFDFDLPERLIAQTPLTKRDESKLLTLNKETGMIEHHQFKEIIDYLNPGDALVLNDTKVLPARLFGIKKETGAKVEILLLKQLENNRWETLVKPGKKLKVGHEVGAGIILNGQLFLGHGFGAGEIGHIKVVENGERCMCGNFGCLETVCSSRAVTKRAQAIAQKNPDSTLNRWASTPADLDFETVLQSFEAGDATLQSLVADVGHYLGVAISNLVGVLSVPYVLMAGSVSKFGQPLLDVISQEVENRSLARMVSRTRVELASLGPDIVLLGAAALLVHYDLGVLH